MEKQFPLFYLGLFFVVILITFSFVIGTDWIIDFIGNNKSISVFTKLGICFLGALVFIVSYFVGAFAIPNAMPNPKTKSWLAMFVTFIWGLLVIVIMSVATLNLEHPLRSFLLAIQGYSWAGVMLAWVSNRFRTVVKI